MISFESTSLAVHHAPRWTLEAAIRFEAARIHLFAIGSRSPA